jgi:Family of unknown function (DUF6232)
MGLPLRFQPFPKMWAIESAREPLLRFGAKRVALSDISNVTSEVVAESDHWGVMFMGMLFLAGAMGLLIGVNHFGWRTRFVFGAALLFFFGMVSLYEAMRTRLVHYTRLRLETKSGEVLFTSADPAGAQALMVALQKR